MSATTSDPQPIRAPRGPLPWESGSTTEPPIPAVVLADDILERCRGEGPANCVGQCPLHVDARAYVQLAKEGRFDEALQKVREQLPFPGILGYVCAHPCELHCKRIDEDSAIRVRDIKRFLADREEGAPKHILTREPDRDASIAVVGSGPAGLIAAHDLRRKGYRVALYEQEAEIGGCLVSKLPDFRLPRRVVERDLSIVRELQIETRTGVRFGEDVQLEDLRREHAAVVLCLGYEGGQIALEEAGAFSRSPRGTVGVDPLTCGTGTDGVFAAGDAASGPGTVIQALAHGRRAAESAHRYVQGRSLVEDREPALPPRLLWTLEIDEDERARRERTPVMLTPYNDAMTEQEVLEDAERCLDCECGLCLEDCEFLTKHCDSSPKELARKIRAGVEIPETLEMVYSCNICSLCARVCPEDLDTGRMILNARREAVERSVGPRPQHKPIVNYWKAGVSDLFTLTMPEPGRQKAKRAFFTGCALPAVMPDHTMRVYEELRRASPGVGVMMLCCGAPVELMGMEKESGLNRDMILRQAESLGVEELLPACPDCAHALHETVPELTITPVWEVLAESWEPPRKREGVTVSIHDSCKAQLMPELHSAIRTLVDKGGAEVNEIEYRGEKARCCGFGGMIYPIDSELSETITKRRADESESPMVTYCAGCRMALRGVGKESIHVLDLLLEDDWSAKAKAEAPGALKRYWNRLRTKWRFKRLKPLNRA
jgi:NADPH-dependent glutamate synthase beta subunit-like oxidoreductase